MGTSDSLDKWVNGLLKLEKRLRMVKVEAYRYIVCKAIDVGAGEVGNLVNVLPADLRVGLLDYLVPAPGMKNVLIGVTDPKFERDWYEIVPVLRQALEQVVGPEQPDARQVRSEE